VGFFDRILDFLSSIPHAAGLQRQIDQLEKEKSDLKDEIASLKDDLRQANAKSKSLRDEVQRLTAIEDLDDTEKRILVIVAEAGDVIIEDELLVIFEGLSNTRLQYHLDRLNQRNFIYASQSGITKPTVWHLAQPGREYLVRNNLIR
jgi:chromosome segregation ATPase